MGKLNLTTIKAKEDKKWEKKLSSITFFNSKTNDSNKN